MLVGNKPELMAWDSAGHLVKKAECKGEGVAAVQRRKAQSQEAGDRPLSQRIIGEAQARAAWSH